MSGRIVAHMTVPRRQRRATFVLPPAAASSSWRDLVEGDAAAGPLG